MSDITYLIARAREIMEFSEDAQVIGDLAHELEKSQPRVIKERHEENGPDELPAFSVVLSGGQPAIMGSDQTFMDYDGCTYDTWEMTYPLTVIFEPEETK